MVFSPVFAIIQITVFRHSRKEDEMKRVSLVIPSFAAILILTVLACGGGPMLTPTPKPLPMPTITRTPPATKVPTQPPLTGEVTILDTSAFMFLQQYCVVGIIRNDTNQALKSIELTIKMTDASGNSLLKDNDGKTIPTDQFNPAMGHLLPGEEGPFIYISGYLSAEPASYKVTVTGQQLTQFARANVEVRNAQMVNTNYWLYTNGDFLQLNGVVINLSDQWINVGNISGAGLDAQGNILTAQWAMDWAPLLAPVGDPQGRDRTPFKIGLPNPGNVTHWAFYVDAEPLDGFVRDPGNQFALEVANHYLDSRGDYHIVGWMVNNSSMGVIVPSIVGGVFASDGTVLEVSMGSAGTSFYVEAGSRVPFDVTNFDIIKTQPQQASRLDHCTVQFLLNQVFLSQEAASVAEYVNLQSKNDQVQKGHEAWVITGDFTNTSDKNLRWVDIIVLIYNSQGDLVATGTGFVSPPSGVIAPNKTSHYQTRILIDPTVDYSQFTYEVLVRGSVSK